MLALPLLLLAIFTKWGVLIAVIVAITVGLGIWVWQRGFVFVEIVAFLIHFDGLGAGPITMGRVMAGVAVLLIGYKLISGWRPPAIPVRHWVPIWALTTWGVISGLWSPEAGSWFFAFGVFGLGLAFFCITALLVDTHRMVQQFLRAYWVGGLFGSGAGILALFLGTRSVGFGGDPNFFGLLQASMIPLTVYYRRHAPDARTKLFYSFILAIVLAGAAGAGSRSGLIGGAVAIVATMALRPGLTPSKRVGVGFGSILLAGFAFVVGFVVNPNNLERGFGDRGAGRIDLWNVSIVLIKQKPMLGYGFGQLREYLPPALLLTPGSLRLSDLRPDVSAHNTWLDVQGDLGVVGLLLFVVIFLVALLGFVRPRWLQTKELSVVLFVMMLPVLTGSFFLPLINNKLAWALIGLSAALQVPSWEARWSGRTQRAGPGPPTSSALARIEPDDSSDALALMDQDARTVSVVEERWEPVRLARWDQRIPRRFLVMVAVAALGTGFIVGVAGSTLPTTHTATVGILVPRVDGSLGRKEVAFDRTRLQNALTMAVSGAYAQELVQMADLDLSIQETRDGLSATRPRMGSTVEITYSDTDLARVEAVGPVLVSALDKVYSDTQAFAAAQTEDELRPTVPGESRIYTGPTYLPSFPEVDLGSEPPPVGWFVFVGTLAGAMIGLGWLLAGQRRPRVQAEDDLRRRIGLPVWAHVGARSGRHRATRDQFAQILATAGSMGRDDQPARKVVVASARSQAATRTLAVGLAAEVLAQGGRALLVDARVGRPLLTARLGGLGRPGLREAGEGEAELADVVRRVNPLRLPRSARRRIGGAAEDLRFLPSGRLRRSAPHGIDPSVLDRMDPDVTIVVLAPPVLGTAPISALFRWSDALVLGAVVGWSSTEDLEDAAAWANSFAPGARGAVLLDG